MGFPKRLLADHERLVLDLRPHWIALAGPVLLTILVIVAQVLALRFIPEDWPSWTRWAVTAVLAALFLFVAVREFLAWVTSHFVVTSDRLIHRSGWLAKRSMEMPLERINDVSFHQTVLERMVGAGDLVIESAGEYGQNSFSDIRKPESVQKTIYELSEENAKRMSDDVDTPVEQLERLDALRERGAISDQEYETAKKRLLEKM
jgi:uncharacterized membrane protein YdbT with pleckstrin-like domain